MRNLSNNVQYHAQSTMLKHSQDFIGIVLYSVTRYNLIIPLKLHSLQEA